MVEGKTTPVDAHEQAPGVNEIAPEVPSTEPTNLRVLEIPDPSRSPLWGYLRIRWTEINRALKTGVIDRVILARVNYLNGVAVADARSRKTPGRGWRAERSSGEYMGMRLLVEPGTERPLYWELTRAVRDDPVYHSIVEATIEHSSLGWCKNALNLMGAGKPVPIQAMIEHDVLNRFVWRKVYRRFHYQSANGGDKDKPSGRLSLMFRHYEKLRKALNSESFTDSARPGAGGTWLIETAETKANGEIGTAPMRLVPAPWFAPVCLELLEALEKPNARWRVGRPSRGRTAPKQKAAAKET